VEAGHRGGLFKLIAGLAHGPRDVAARVYTAGVLAMITGDLMYPPHAFGLQLTGRVAMGFVPAEGRIEWTTLDTAMPTPGGVVSDGWLRDRQSPRARDALHRHLDEAGLFQLNLVVFLGDLC
jgi:hypothetical protein